LNPLEGLGNDEIDAGADYLSVMPTTCSCCGTLGCS
jgi:hypothetical protein